ncbi:MAG: GNAT family N-acetyltransferase [Candidatus Hermodarchaeota archaeon]
MPIKLSESLDTKRLYIRQLTQEDYECLVRKLNDANTEEEYPLFSYYETRDVKCFLLQLREDQQIVGYIFLRTSEIHKDIEIYYSLFPRFTGNGYAIEALKKVFEYIFTNYDFVNILAFVEEGNTRGWKVAERSGMMYMGSIFHTSRNSKVMYFLISKRDYLNQYKS